MKELKEKQITLILKMFPDTCAGAKEIARKLITNGKCIVAGTSPIWRGGIGNFIKTKNAENAVDCLEYTFDVDYFITSDFFQEFAHHELDQIRRELQSIQDTAMCVAELVKK